MYTIADLLADSDLETISLTPGTGLANELTWAHVCELGDPWNWLGKGALVMTVGFAIPARLDEQLEYIERASQAGISGVTIGENMSAPPLHPEMLSRAKELGFAVLETGRYKPFVALAQAVSNANITEQQHRLTLAKKIYEILTINLEKVDLHSLLNDLGDLLEGTLRIIASSETKTETSDEWNLHVPLPTIEDYVLQLTSRTIKLPDKSLLQYASAAVASLLAIRSASRNKEIAQGALLFGRLISDGIDAETARELFKTHSITAPYRILAWHDDSSSASAEAVGNALAEKNIANLCTTRKNHMVVLASSKEPDATSVAPHNDTLKIGLSAPFTNLRDVPAAFAQARTALDFPSVNRINFFEDLHDYSPFLGGSTEQNEEAAIKILQPIIDNDEKLGTQLLLTLKTLLEENRSWKQTAAKLHIHRQTLYARIARIEALTGRDLTSVSAISDFWLALQIASALGVLNFKNLEP